jgi:hypothetical protein
VVQSSNNLGNFVDQQREERIHVRVSVVEKRKFEKLAKARHTDLSEIVRQLLHSELDRVAKAGA